MPKTRPLTQEQREAQEVARLGKEILDRMNEKRGRENKTKQQFSEEIGVPHVSWWRWNKGEIDRAEFGKVVTAALRCGIRLRVEV